MKKDCLIDLILNVLYFPFRRLTPNIKNKIFEVLFSIANNSRQLKKIGFSDQEIKESFNDHFDKAKNSDFMKFLKS